MARVAGDIAALVDLARYPIADLEAPEARDLVARCRRDLERLGALTLPGLIRDEAIGPLAEEGRALAPLAYELHDDHTCYFAPPDEGFPAGHPRRTMMHTDQGGVAADRIGARTMLRRLYQWDALTDFIAAVIGEARLYRHADSMAALNINVFATGQQLNWHFDRTDFSVTLSLQTPEAGGTFEYVPRLRGPDDENYDGVARTLAGNRKGVRRLVFPPGTLAVFRGHHSLHRVTPVRGPRSRLAAVLSYVREPGVTFTPYAQKLFYGRTEESAG